MEKRICCYAIVFVLWTMAFGLPKALGQALVSEGSPIELAEDGPYFSRTPTSEAGQSTSALMLETGMLEGEDRELLHQATSCDCGTCSTCQGEEGIAFGDWLGYNAAQSDTTWLAGTGDNLGMFSLESFPTLDLGGTNAFAFGSSIHWVNGPIATDLPPRLYDLVLAYQRRRALSDRLMIDWRTSVGAFTDFESSVRKGIRFPGHAVGFYEWHPWFVSALGVEVLDRDDISVLPVVGAIWRAREDLIIEAIFPRPKVQFRIRPNRSLYLAGELGGGTWAIERADSTRDNATYRDLRLVVGLLDFDDDNTAIEVGWAFARKLQYRSGLGDYHPDDTFLLRWRTHF